MYYYVLSAVYNLYTSELLFKSEIQINPIPDC